jgi:acyl-phosphate glycerol 3-phosphate acyltransferase
MDENHTALIAVVTETSDTAWLSEMTGNGSIMQYANAQAGIIGLSEAKITSFDALLNEFLPLIQSCGMILWDGNVPATANVAATMCGLDGYLPVLANSPLHNLLISKGVPVKQSLVGLFRDGQRGSIITGTTVASTGSAKNDAYLWALEKYFDRCSSQYLAYTLDGAVCLKGYAACLIGRALGGDAGMLTGGLCAILGHDFPVFMGFKGGKGIATSLGLIIAINPWLALALLAVQIVAVALTRYMSVASLITTVAFPILVIFTERSRENFPLFLGAACIASALSLFGHRSNIQRLIHGEENRLDFQKISKVSEKVLSKMKRNNS